MACGLFFLCLRARRFSPWLLWALAIAAWICVHASGVHATVAGIVLGLLVPVTRLADEDECPGERFEHRLHPLSAGFVVPLFALAVAGIPLAAAGDALHEPIAIGVVAGLLLGKPVGILAGANVAVRLGVGMLPPSVSWRDVVPVAVLGGIGYTVSLLISRLAFADPALEAASAAAVLIGSAASALVAVALLRRRSTRPERGHPFEGAGGD